MEYGVYRDLVILIPEAIFYLFTGDYRLVGFRDLRFKCLGLKVPEVQGLKE